METRQTKIRFHPLYWRDLARVEFEAEDPPHNFEMSQDVRGILAGLPAALDRLGIRMTELHARLGRGSGPKDEEIREWEEMIELARSRVEALSQRHLRWEDASPYFPVSTNHGPQGLSVMGLNDPEVLYDVWKEVVILAEWTGRWGSDLLDMEDSVNLELDLRKGGEPSYREILRLIRNVTRTPRV
jgi:hypothetical protein